MLQSRRISICLDTLATSAELFDCDGTALVGVDQSIELQVEALEALNVRTIATQLPCSNTTRSPSLDLA